MKRAITDVIVADDHTLFRAGLVRLLNTFPAVRVVAETANATETLSTVGRIEADVLMLDLSMPGAAGTSLVEAVHAKVPELPILVLSMHDEAALIRQALKGGASGYVTKNSEPEILGTAIEKLAQGERYLAPVIAQVLAFEFVEPQKDNGLTSREAQILKMIAKDGLPLVQIANLLGLSPKTVTTHKTNIMAKLKVSNNAELVKYALSHEIEE